MLSFDVRDEGDGPVQVVVCDARYAYAWPWPDEPLKVGDRVVVPGGRYGAFQSVVTSVGSFYEGRLTRLLRRDKSKARARG